MGYSLSHAFGAVFDNPDLIVACVVGDGEAETGPLATAWHSNKFLNPVTDGAVLPILHLNGYKIANPTILARITHEELKAAGGYGWTPYFVEGDEPAKMHQAMAATLDQVRRRDPADPERCPHTKATPTRPRWPMIVLKSPKGWTGPKVVDGLPVEGTFRGRTRFRCPTSPTNPKHLKQLEELDEKLQAGGTFRRARQAHAGSGRAGARRASGGWAPIRTPMAGMLLRDLRMPDFRDYAVMFRRRARSRPKTRACWAGSCAT